jgi:hypothetical protein
MILRSPGSLRYSPSISPTTVFTDLALRLSPVISSTHLALLQTKELVAPLLPFLAVVLICSRTSSTDTLPFHIPLIMHTERFIIPGLALFLTIRVVQLLVQVTPHRRQYTNLFRFLPIHTLGHTDSTFLGIPQFQTSVLSSS